MANFSALFHKEIILKEWLIFIKLRKQTVVMYTWIFFVCQESHMYHIQRSWISGSPIKWRKCTYDYIALTQRIMVQCIYNTVLKLQTGPKHCLVILQDKHLRHLGNNTSGATLAYINPNTIKSYKNYLQNRQHMVLRNRPTLIIGTERLACLNSPPGVQRGTLA